MRRVYYLYPGLVLAVFLGIIQLSTLTPYWNTSTRTISGISADTGQPGQDGPAAGGQLFSTADIKGSWTLSDVSSTFQVPTAEILSHFALPPSVPDSTAVKDLKSYNAEFEPSMLRDWLKERSPVAAK